MQVTFNWFYMNERFSYYQCQKQYYTYLLKVLAKDKYIDTYLTAIYVLTSSTMSVDVYSACVDFEFQNKTWIALCEEISLSHENKA